MPWYSYSQEVAWPVEHQDLVALEKERVVRACISGAGGTVPLSLSERRLFARWTCYEAYATSPACPTPRDETPEDCTDASDPDPPAASQSINHSVELWEANGPPTPPSTPPQPEGAPPSPPLTPPGQGADTSFRPGCFACSNAEQHEGKKPVPSPRGRGFGRTAETKTTPRAQTLMVTIEGEDNGGPRRDNVSVKGSGRIKRA